ncbi:hypothetical protein K8R14_03385 [bacterium]|nr:hypothetical protein [bacterium]
MKQFLKKNWGKILLATILVVILSLSFKVGYSYISNDNYSPDLNPLLTIERSIISPAWRSYRGLGFASESEQTDVFRSVFYYVTDIFLPTWSLSQIFALLCFGVGSWFTGLLASNLVRDFSKEKYSELAFLLSGIFYITTLWTVWVYYLNMFPYISQFGFLPLLVWSIYRLVKDFNWKNALITFFCSIVFTSTCVIATLFVVDVVVIFFLTLTFAIFHTKGLKEIFKKVFLTMLLFVCTQLFWILPFVHYTVNVSGDIVDSYVNRSITTSVIDLEHEALDSIDSARMYTRILETTDDMVGEKYLFPDAEEYMVYDFYKFVALIPAILGVIGIVFSIVKKRWKLLLLSILTVGSWFIIKNLNQPLGETYSLLQEYVPLFKQVFRWPSSKIGQIYVFSLSLIAPFGFVYLLEFLTSVLKRKVLKVSLWVVSTLMLITMLLYFSSYMFVGDLFVERSIVVIPEEYYHLEQYLNENDNKGRILYLPTANSSYFREYDWGFIGSGFLHYIVPNPLIDMSLAIGSNAGEEAMRQLKDFELSHDVESLERFLEQYDTKYVLIDRNLVKGRYGHELDWTISNILAERLDLVWNDSDIYLYKTAKVEERLTESMSPELNTFTREVTVSPTLTPLNMQIKNWKIEENEIVGTFIHEGQNVYQLLTNGDIDIYSLPSSLVLEDNHIIVKPAIPTINDISTGISKTFDNVDYDYYMVGEKVFTKSQLEIGVSVDIQYTELIQIYGVREGDWNTDNMTSHIASNGKAGNCSGTEFEEDISIQLQGQASGFSVSGDSELPCIYSSIDLFESGVAKIELNWENITENTYVGYCLYSQQYEKCVNEEKYIYSEDQLGQEEILLPYRLNKSDDLTLTIYVYSPTLDDVETIFRNIQISILSNLERISVSSYKETLYKAGILLENTKEYTLSIPVIYGDSSYIYFSSTKENMIWKMNDAQDGGELKVEWNNGISQTVQGQYLNQYTTLFNTKGLDRYLWYWSGQNISNIPSTLCLTYASDDKCWVEDMFFDNEKGSNLNFFRSIGNKRLDLSYRSVSYEQLSQNKLENFVVMKYPSEWEDIKFVPESSTRFVEYEMDSGGSQSTIYSLPEQLPTNSLITIPQSSSSGWLAISFGNNIPHILKDRVVVNGWKQGWDISNTDYNNIWVIYYPNLLAYLGYTILVTEFFVILFNLVKRRNGKE